MIIMVGQALILQDVNFKSYVLVTIIFQIYNVKISLDSLDFACLGMKPTKYLVNLLMGSIKKGLHESDGL